MRRRIFLTVFFCLCVIRAGLAREEATALFRKANAAYAGQNYEEAISFYESIVQQGKYSGPVFYNLGNAYFKKGQLGRAILNYERALEWIPRDADLRANARYARSLVQKVEGQPRPAFAGRMAEKFFRLHTANEMAWMILALAFLFVLVHVCSLYFHWPKTRKRIMLGVVAALIIFYTVGLIDRNQRIKNSAVILQDAGARFEPRADATTHFQMFEGNFITAQRKENGWVKVQRFDGKTGWLRQDAVEKIVKSEE